ncbi:YbeD family protein [Planctomicrobium sp. SH661]|uniref:YbeD family protein n=1 Tax=Planctomicrobium sp. SH661 TaxID=3448124 RepID=UPI003F5C142C
MSDGLPDLELLQSTHQFPGPYTFKAIGTPDDQFVGRVLAAVKAALEEDIEPSFSCRTTPSGRHVCVTIEPDVESAPHVHEIYRNLQGVDGLFMLM